MTEEITTKLKRRRYVCDPKTPAGTEPKAQGGKQETPRRETKIGKIIALLERDEGATLEEMVQATSWLSHTTRAALTGLKKKGHAIERDKRGEASCYRITKGA